MYKIHFTFSFRKFTDIFSLSEAGVSSTSTTSQCSEPSITGAKIVPAVSNIDANSNYTVACEANKTLQSNGIDVDSGSMVLVCTNGHLVYLKDLPLRVLNLTCIAAGKSI